MRITGFLGLKGSKPSDSLILWFLHLSLTVFKCWCNLLSLSLLLYWKRFLFSNSGWRSGLKSVMMTVKPLIGLQPTQRLVFSFSRLLVLKRIRIGVSALAKVVSLPNKGPCFTFFLIKVYFLFSELLPINNLPLFYCLSLFYWLL